MASKKTLTAENLEALGAKRLAELLLDIAEGDAATKRRFRLELAAREAPETVAAEVRKRLAQIARARSFVDWRKLPDLAADLEAQRRTIVDQVAKIEAAETLELMWRFVGLAESVHERCDDSNGVIGDVFRAACRDLGRLAEITKPDPIALADRMFTALNENGYGQYDHLIETLSPSLGAKGVDRLKARFIELSKTPVEKPPEEERKVIGWGSGGPLYEDEIKARDRESTVRLAMREIADARATSTPSFFSMTRRRERSRRSRSRSPGACWRAGRAEEAFQTIEAAEHRRDGWPEFDWEDARIEALDALGHGDEALAARWLCFERALSAEHLRAYLKRFPTSTMSRPRSGRSIMRSAMRACFRRWRSSSPGPPWTGSPASSSCGRPSSMATITRS